jgi:hypothetical protein
MTAEINSQTRFRIAPKRDFGEYAHLINGKYVKRGFVVTFANGTYCGCNAMPGATWFLTIADAMEAAERLVRCGGDADKFWAETRAKRAA